MNKHWHSILRRGPWAPVLLAALSSCAMLAETTDTAYEVGALEFQAGDELIIDRLDLDRSDFEPGAIIRVEGRYRLDSRSAATLYLGTTVSNASEASFNPKESNRITVESGEGTFALTHRIPGHGYPHLTFYDRETGAPFGGIYFGKGETVLHERSWSYDN